MKISHKLMLGCICIVLLIGVMGIFAVHTSRRALQETLGADFNILAGETMDKIDRCIQRRLEQLQAYARDLGFEPRLHTSNQEFEKLPDVQTLIETRDKVWAAAPIQQLTPFMESLIRNELAVEVAHEFELKEFYQEKYGYPLFGEVFVTNRYGANIAQTNKTSDYYQADETWWQQARDNGSFVGDVVFDESAGINALDLAVAIRDTSGQFAGVVKAVLNIESLAGVLAHVKRQSDYHSTHLSLFASSGRRLCSDASAPPEASLYQALQVFAGQHHFPACKDYLVCQYPGLPEQLVVHAHSRGYRDFHGLDMTLLITHDHAEVMAPVAALGKMLGVLTLTVTVVAGGLSLWLVLSITGSLARLQKLISEAGKGGLPIQTGITSHDEIGQLAVAMEDMSHELLKTIQSLDREVLRSMLAHERTELLNELQERLLRPASLSAKLRLITDAMVDVLGADFARIWITRPGDRCECGCVHAQVKEGPHVCRDREHCLHLLASSGRYTHLDGEGHQRVPFGCYKIGQVAAAETAGFFTNEVTEDSCVHNHEWARELGLVGFAGCRILASNGDPKGVIAYFSQKEISKEDVAFLECLASIAGHVVWTSEAELAFRKRETQLQSIMDSLALGSMVIESATHRIIEINQSAADLFGLPIEAIIGSRREMFLELSQADLNRIREGQTLHKREAGLTRSDGCLITVTMSVIPIHEQGHNYLAVNFFDISDISTGAPKSVVSVGEIQD